MTISYTPINVVFRLPLLEKPQCFCQMIVQGHRFMSEFSDEEILLLDFFLERSHSLELVFGFLQRLVCLGGLLFSALESLFELFNLSVRTLDQFAEFLLSGWKSQPL